MDMSQIICTNAKSRLNTKDDPAGGMRSDDPGLSFPRAAYKVFKTIGEFGET